MGLIADADKELTEALKNASRRVRMEANLSARFPGAVIRVRDESALHAGHSGARPEGETHFHVAIEWSGFSGLSRVARHRAVTEALAAEFEGGLHALSIEAQSGPQPGSGA